MGNTASATASSAASSTSSSSTTWETGSLLQWLKVYLNEDTREKAIPYFWKEVYKPQEWSLWKVDYKYKDELTAVFMTNNLANGFITRLSGCYNRLFVSLVVYGKDHDNGITGFLLVRGEDYEPVVKVAGDWESYSYKRLDGSDAKARAFVDNMLAWDEPVEVDGRLVPIASGQFLR